MAKLEYILTQNSPPNSSTMGGKAAALAALDGKWDIPKWFVLTPQAFLDCLSATQQQKLESGEPIGEIHFKSSVEEAIALATKRLTSNNQLLAVRSSATTEDGAHASLAGQLESYLNVSPQEVHQKIREIWYSTFYEHVAHYQKKIGSDASCLPAVIVQHMVQADVAGMAFSADPVTGDRTTCVINATRGLADKLVSGKINGDTYHAAKNGKTKTQHLSGELPVLSQKMIAEIITLLIKTEKHFGMAQDIEWAIENDKLYLLQARPITSLQTLSLSGRQVTLWDNSNIVESYSGVTSPLTFSFARYVYEHVYIEFCKLMGVGATSIEQENNTFRNMLGFVNGHVYYNLINWYRTLALFPGFKMNRKWMEQMMGIKEPLPEEIIQTIVPNQPSLLEKMTDGFRLVRTLGGLIWHQIKLKSTIKRFYKRLNGALVSSESLENLSLDQLALAYRTLETKLLKKWDAPLVNDFLCMIAFGLSRNLLQKHAGQEGLNLHNDIMIAQGDIISAEPAMRIAQMADIASRDRNVVARLIAADATAIHDIPELKKEYKAYLDKFGVRCLQELKLESLSLHDDPTMLLQAIGHMALRDKKPKETSKTHTPKEQLLRLLAKNPIKRWLIIAVVLWAKARVRDRENLRFERTRVFGRVRAIFLEIGKRFHELHHLDASRDIFFLEVSEIMGLIEGTSTMMNAKQWIKIRINEQEKFHMSSTPPNRFETCGASFLAFRSQAYCAHTPSKTLDVDSIKGIGCCQGVVQATVRVITNPREAELKPGEIMVAKFTDPGWITLFANASGILVERGSLLSHSAIVARELGIPAIVGIDNVMQWLKNGDVVEMNGTTGIVRKIEDGGTHDNNHQK